MGFRCLDLWRVQASGQNDILDHTESNWDWRQSETSDLSEISYLLLFVSYFAAQCKGVLCKLKLFGHTSDTCNKVHCGNYYNHWKILVLVLDLNSNPKEKVKDH